MPQNPLVSVILPVYNTEKYVSESIRSVLGQTYSPIEVICVDDGSTDKSLGILKSFGDKITIVELAENSGIAAARNAGLRMGRGEFIAFADADDMWKPRKLEKQMQGFHENPNADISFCMIQNFISPELSGGAKSARHCPPGPMSGQVSPTVVMKKSTFEKIGELNPAYRVGEFIDWMARANAAGLGYFEVPEVLALRRIHETNTGIVARASRTDYLKIAKAALDRRRAMQK